MPVSDELLTLAGALPGDFDTRRTTAAALISTFAVEDVDLGCLTELTDTRLETQGYVKDKEDADSENEDNLELISDLDIEIDRYERPYDDPAGPGLIAQAQYTLDHPPADETTASVNLQITNGRAALVAKKHYVLTRNFDWKGVTDVTALVYGFKVANSTAFGGTNTIPTGTLLNPVTIDFWPGATQSTTGRPNAEYLMDGGMLLSGWQNTTWNLHGSICRTRPPKSLGICTIDGRTPIVGSYSTASPRTITGSFPIGPQITANSFVNKTIQARASSSATSAYSASSTVGIPVAATITAQTTTTLTLSADIVAVGAKTTWTNQTLYVNDGSRVVTSDGTGFGAFNSPSVNTLKGLAFVMKMPMSTHVDEVHIDYAIDATHLATVSRDGLSGSPNFDYTAEAWAVSGGLAGSWPVGTPRTRNRIQWNFQNCTNIKLTNGFIVGALPPTWQTSSTNPIPYFVTDVESQHAIQAAGGSNIEISYLNIRNVWGDFLYVSSVSGVNATGVWFHDNDCARSGRHGISPCQANNFRASNNKFHYMGRSVVDIEMLQSTWDVDGVEIDHNEVGLSTNNFIGSVADGRCDNVNVHHNQMKGRPLAVSVDARAYTKGVPTDSPAIPKHVAANQWLNWSFNDNVGETVTGNTSVGAVCEFNGIKGMTFSGNTQSFKLSSAVIPVPFMYGAIGVDVNAPIIVYGNHFTDAKNQARFAPDNTVITPPSNPHYVDYPIAISAKAGLPTIGCMVGAVCSGQTGTVAPHSSPNSVSGVTQLESALGRTIDIHRIFCSPGDLYNVNARDTELRDDAVKGRVSILSMKIPSTQTWFSMTSSPLLQTAADRLKFYTETVGCRIVFLVEHEIDRKTVQNGTVGATDAQARAQYSNLVTAQFTKIKATCNPALVTTCVQTSYYRLYLDIASPSNADRLTPAQIKEYFPTDLSLMDCYGTDVYNDPKTTSSKSVPFDKLVEGHLSLASSIGKPLVLHEVGCAIIANVCSASGGGGPTRDQWVQGVYDYLYDNPTIKELSWYHSNNNAISPADPGGADGTDWVHDWWMDDTTNLKNVHKANIVTQTNQYGTYFTRNAAAEQTDGAPLTKTLLTAGASRTVTVVTGTNWDGLKVDTIAANTTYDLRNWTGNGYFACDAVAGLDGRAYGLPDFRAGTTTPAALTYAGTTQTFPPASGTPYRNTSPYRFGNTTAATGFCVVGAKVVGMQPGVLTLPWNAIKHGSPCQAMLDGPPVDRAGATDKAAYDILKGPNQDGNAEIHTAKVTAPATPTYSVTSACRFDNTMDGVAIVGSSNSKVKTDLENGIQYFRNCWMRNVHDDCIENDNCYLTVKATDCLFEDVHSWLSCKDDGPIPGSIVKAWFIKDSIVKLLPRPGPSDFETSYMGHGSFYKLDDQAPGIRLTNCVLAAEKPAVDDKLFLPTRTVSGTLIDTYSNVVICWLGTGTYPSLPVPPGCTLLTGAEAVNKINAAILNWKIRHGVTDFDNVDMVQMLAPTPPPNYVTI